MVVKIIFLSRDLVLQHSLIQQSLDSSILLLFISLMNYYALHYFLRMLDMLLNYLIMSKLCDCRPGSIQARGENLISLLKALSSSLQLRNAQQRADLRVAANSTQEDRPIFFDYLSWFMV
jgi:hypothetical protein